MWVPKFPDTLAFFHLLPGWEEPSVLKNSGGLLCALGKHLRPSEGDLTLPSL